MPGTVPAPARYRAWVTDATDRARALALDAADPLAGFRDRFVIADERLIYLDGNSLGRLPRSTVDRLGRAVVEEWGGDLVRGGRGGWSWPAPSAT
jgi:kynureninase